MVGDENPPKPNHANNLDGLETERNVEEIQRFVKSRVSRFQAASTALTELFGRERQA